MKSRVASFWIIIISQVMISYPTLAAVTQEDLVIKLYLDLAGVRPSTSQITSMVTSLKAAKTASDRRAVVAAKIVNELMLFPTFGLRLKNYFNGLMGVSDRTGLILPLCSQVSNTQPCLSPEAAQDFRDEMAMLITKTVTGDGQVGRSAPHDIRNILSSSFTVMTPDMAMVFDGKDSLKSKFGLDNIPANQLRALATDTVSRNWTFIDRDPGHLGLQAADDKTKEYHAGVLTTPAYLVRSPTHVSRAYNFYSWFLCQKLDQATVTESSPVKLMNRTPCSGCHSVLEPLGSFWIFWRPKTAADQVAQRWLLDGVKRVDANQQPLSTDGTLPLDVDDPGKVHSRSLTGVLRNQSGKGVLELAEIAVNDADFPRCMARHAWQLLLRRAMQPEEQGWARELGERLTTEYNGDLRQVIVDIALSKAYFPWEDLAQ